MWASRWRPSNRAVRQALGRGRGPLTGRGGGCGRRRSTPPTTPSWRATCGSRRSWPSEQRAGPRHGARRKRPGGCLCPVALPCLRCACHTQPRGIRDAAVTVTLRCTHAMRCCCSFGRLSSCPAAAAAAAAPTCLPACPQLPAAALHGGGGRGVAHHCQAAGAERRTGGSHEVGAGANGRMDCGVR